LAVGSCAKQRGHRGNPCDDPVHRAAARFSNTASRGSVAFFLAQEIAAEISGFFEVEMVHSERDDAGAFVWVKGVGRGIE
jgi:hypothetical protein